MAWAEVLIKEVQQGLWLFARADGIENVDDATIRQYVDTLAEKNFLNKQRIAQEGTRHVAAWVIFRFLIEERAIVYYDSECIYGYRDSYEELIEEYVAAANGALDDLHFEVYGDWAEDRYPRINAFLPAESGASDEQYFQTNLKEIGDWTDTTGLIEFLNQVVAATEEVRRFEYIVMTETQGQDIAVVYANPDHFDSIREFFQVGRTEYRKRKNERRTGQDE